MEAKELLRLYAEGRRDFQEANLCDADLREAELVGANLTGANLSNANFSRANLSDANLSTANLSSARLVKADLSFADLSFADLSFANLVVANLRGANLRETNLNQASLNQVDVSEADISGAKLLQSRFISTNFENATLTGACIEDWHINAQTNFSNVICNYIYLKRDNQERRPHDLSKNFEPEDFSKLVEQSLETVDLIFRNGIDWKAFFSSFVELQSEAEGEISIRAIEKKSDDAFVIRVDVSAQAGKAEIEHSFLEKYNRELTFIEEKYKYQLQAKQEQIEIYKQQNTNLTEITKVLAQNPFNINNKNINNPQGDLTMTENQNPTTYNQSGPMGIGHMSGGEIKDNAKVAGIINEAEQQNLADAVTQVQQILQQLSQTYPTETMSERIAIANEAIKEIEANPTIKQRLINAATEGGLAVIEKAFDNPIGALFVGVIKGWKEAE